MGDNMDFKQVSYIIKVAECQNITKAARELFISQPSLSQFISKAEDELGVKLFDRSTNPLTLTYAGEKYIEAAKEILRINKEIQDELQDIAECRKGRIVLGIPSERGGYMLPPVLKRFREIYPEVEVKTKEANTDFLLEELKRGKLDFIIVPERELPKELEGTLIYEEELLFVAGDGVIDRSHCKDGYANVIDWEKVREMPFIILKKGHGSRRKCEEVFESHHVEPNVIFETNSNSTALRMTANGIGVTMVPEMTVNLFHGAQRFNTYSLDVKPVTWNVLAVHRKDTYQNKAQKEFIRIAAEIFGKNTSKM